MNRVRYLEDDGAILRYGIFGDGPVSLLGFHGAGDDLFSFKKLTKKLSDNYTLYSFDLFFHGESHLPANTVLKPDCWYQLMDKFLARHQIEKFSLLGFSLGGKFVLSTFSHFNERIINLILIAPDGIKLHTLYKIATHNFVSRAIFKWIMSNPVKLTWVTKTLSTIGILNSSLAKFVYIHIKDLSSSMRIYNSWVMLRKLKVDITFIGELISNHGVNLTVIVGKNDQVIKISQVEPLIKIVDSKLIVFEQGHNKLISAYADSLENN